MSDPENYQYDIDCVEVAELWRRGSVVGSWLLDLTADVLRHDPNLDKFDGGVSDSGEGRWTLHSVWISVYPLLLLVLPSLKDSTQGNLVNTETKS